MDVPTLLHLSIHPSIWLSVPGVQPHYRAVCPPHSALFHPSALHLREGSVGADTCQQEQNKAGDQPEATSQSVWAGAPYLSRELSSLGFLPAVREVWCLVQGALTHLRNERLEVEERSFSSSHGHSLSGCRAKPAPSLPMLGPCLQFAVILQGKMQQRHGPWPPLLTILRCFLREGEGNPP